MKMTKIFFALTVIAFLSACESEPSEDLQDSIVEVTPETAGDVNPTALFDPSNSVIPFPNNVLFSGSLDGTLNIPVADANYASDPAVAMNTVDGFSTVAPMSAAFSTAIDETTIPAAVKVYQVTLCSDPLLSCPPIAGPVAAVNSTLTFGVDYFATLSSVDSSQSTLVIVPLKPLEPETSYMVVITDDLMTSDGKPFAPSVTYRLIKTLSDPLVFCPDPTALSCTLPGALRTLTEEELASFEGLRQLINAGEATVAAADATIATSDIIQSWSFTTQSVGEVLTAVRSMVGSPATTVSASSVNLGLGAGLSPAGAAHVFEGTIDVPYYLTVPSVSNPTANLTESWKSAIEVGGENNLTAANPVPAQTATVTIPMLITTPVDTVNFPAPWRTVIFQHGITQARTDILTVADTLAAAGLAVVAIDSPLHGVDSSSPFYQAGIERTFDVDFVTQVGESITAAVPDGVVDTTGAHFANLNNLAVLRDNFRQAAADLFALTAAIPSIDVDGGGADLDGSNIYFVGHSLGVSIGVPFLSLESNVQDAVLGMGGVSFPKIADGSTVFSPQVVNGLAAVGVTKGTADYESFVGAAQTVMDTVDAVNHAEDAANGRGVLLFEVVGGDASPADLFVPNRVPDSNDLSTGTGPTVPAPLAGTEPMIDLMGLDQVSTSQADVSDLKVVVKFTAGDHRSFLTDDASLLVDPPGFASTAVTGNIRTGMASFLGSAGLGLTIADGSVIQAPPP